MRVTLGSRAVLVSVALVATVSVAACTAHPAGNVSGTNNGQTATAASSASASPAGTQPASPSVTAPTATPAATGGVQDLVISNSRRLELTDVFAAHYGIPPSDLMGGGPGPGTVYYAFDSATQTYFARASFGASSTAPPNVQAEINSGDNGIAMFQQPVNAGPWQVQIATDPLICSYVHFYPPAVLSAWLIAPAPPGEC